MPLPTDKIAERARHIRLLLIDCDGVLTDGGIYFTAEGDRVSEATKVFHVRDGQGLKIAREVGLKLGIVSGRSSLALVARAREMKVDHLYQGIEDKLVVYEQIKNVEGLTDKHIAYVGDDLPDIRPMRRAGLAIAVANAVKEVNEYAHFITSKPGGHGAVREVVELILKTQNLWDSAIQRFKL